MKKNIFLLLIIFTSFLSAQYNIEKFSLGISGVYTTSAKIFLNPNSSDEVLRNNFFPLEDILNPAIDIRYRYNENILFGLSTEYLNKSAIGPNLTVFSDGVTVNINVEDGFILIPLELSAYYYFPFSTEQFIFLMGGGIGYYYGEQIRNFGDAEISTTERSFAYGIHVALSTDYVIRDFFSVRLELKFRDPQFSVKSEYNKTEVIYDGTTLLLPQKSFESKINVDGISFLLALVFHL
ncbi:MAG TPA: hypothetical protein PKA80_06155 [Ignavibacteriaceae bacterium]|nr:hypothetical protein [Ignavibacteriaceae bacterium]